MVQVIKSRREFLTTALTVALMELMLRSRWMVALRAIQAWEWRALLAGKIKDKGRPLIH